MNVTVKYFASMRDRMGRGEEVVQLDPENPTIADLLGKIDADNAMPQNTLIAVNQEYTDKSHVIKEGDEVAFFPPVTGG